MLNFGLTAVGGARWIERAAGEVLTHRDVELLTAMQREVRSYVPGFMFPSGDGSASAEDELQQVASTPSIVIARQMSTFVKSARAGGRSESAGFRRIVTALDRGERSFAQRIARELGHFWSVCLAARWHAMRLLIEGDIQHRAAAMARRGLGATLSSLHPALSYESGALRIEDERTWAVPESKKIVLHPSPLAKTWMLRDDPWGEDGIHLAYPVRPGLKGDLPTGNAGDHAEADPLGRVIGHARLLLLADLGSSRTTTELAERLHMSASTVSYHLLRLHRVGLLNRTREGSRVYYQRTSEADRLVARRRQRVASRAGLAPQFTDAEWFAGLLNEALPG
jgi:DNA-binding transcriptional ArsR family regulator